MEWTSQFKPLFGTPLNLAHPLARGLVASYLFNEGTGKIVNDSSGQGNNGLCVGMNDPPISTSGWVPGPHGGALAFDGSNDYVNCGTSPSLKMPTNDFTVLANIFNPGNGTIFSTRRWAAGFKFWISTGNMAARMYGGGLDLSKTFTAPVVGGCCLAWCAVRADKLYAYINGLLIDSVALVSIGNFANTEKNKIGISETSVAFEDPFSGLISSVSIYNRALSAEEIAYLYAFPWCMYDRPASAWEYNQQNRNFDHYYRRLMAA